MFHSKCFVLSEIGETTLFANAGIRHHEFLWNKFTGQFALELGYMVTSNFLVKLEAGYDIFSINIEDIITDEDTVSVGYNGNEKVDLRYGRKYNGFYATLGLGYFFG